ncbi:hypothetical protein ACSSWA_10015 [Melioribacter sp. Ez-97]|uniref:hypothetical protein n=1 Tax=Melioribacter sp. Ez-97 TaxID=3423434 RepID=UPI003ED87979
MSNKYLIGLLIIISFTACERKIINEPPVVEMVNLQPLDEGQMMINDFQVKLTNTGLLSVPGLIYEAGLWIGMEKNGEIRGNLIYTQPPYSNYMAEQSGRKIGVYALETGIIYNTSGWPSDLEGQMDRNGPKIYGDKMLWTALMSDTTISEPLFYAYPIKDLLVTAAVYAYNSEDLKDVIFIKYCIKNLSYETWENLRAGFFTDTDIGFSLNNKTAYDSVKQISYTYDTVDFNVAGYKFLETPKNSGVYSHRIMRKNNYINPEFGEYSFKRPEQIMYVLKGLSNDGQPMINPVTNKETLFAFTGDPITRTGWLDSPVDVRSFLSTGELTLKPREKAWLTIALVYKKDNSLKNAIREMKLKIERVYANKSLWDFK